MESISMKAIATMHSAFPSKFGIPRQSGLVSQLQSLVVFEPPYRNPDALRGMEGFSHLWLIWAFSQSIRADWSPTVRPPRLGGNTRMGVFATRSPFRPTPSGLSSVHLEAIEEHPEFGTVLRVSGADLLDGTPILDIKPYLPYTDAHPEAASGFTAGYQGYHLDVVFPPILLERIPLNLRDALIGVLAQDPRPSYQDDPSRVYGMAFAEWNIRFTVKENTLTVVAAEPLSNS